MSNERSEPTLVACPACGSQVSNQAVACPRCGQPIAAGYTQPKPYQREMQPPPQHRVQKPPLTEWEKIVRMLGALTSRLQKQSLTQSLKIGLVFLAIIVPVIVIAALLQGLPNSGNSGSNGNNSNHSNNAENQTSTSQPSPSIKESDLNAPAIKARILRGGKLYNSVEAKYHLPLAFHGGEGGYNPMAFSILIPTSEWNQLSKEDQVDFSLFGEHLVSLVRANPRRYLDRWRQFAGWPTGSEYDDYIEKLSRLCDACWDITVGKIVKGEGGKPDFEDSDTPVTGEDAVQFRQSTEKKIAKTLEAQAENASAEFAASMSPGEHLLKAKKAMETDYDPNARPEPRWGNTPAARNHLEAIPRNAPEYAEAQSLLKEVARREGQDKKFKQEVIRQMKRMVQ